MNAKTDTNVKKATDMVRNDQLTVQKTEDLTMYTETVKLM
jgi:hypothetical protein